MSVEKYGRRLTTLEVEELKPQAAAFYEERIKRIRALEFLPRLEIENSLIVHITPLIAFHKLGKNYLYESELITYIVTMTRGFKGYRYNQDGILIYDANYPDGVVKTYYQFHKNGIFEIYTSEFIDERNPKYIRADRVERLCVDMLERVEKQLYDKLGVVPPLVVSLSLFGLQDKAILPLDKYEVPEINRFDINELRLPPVLFKDFGSSAPAELRGNFDLLWQAAGWSKSAYYEADGRWKGRSRPSAAN